MRHETTSSDCIIDYSKYTIAEYVHDELNTDAYCILEDCEEQREFAVNTIDTNNYIIHISNAISNSFRGEPYDIDNIFLDISALRKISENILYILMYNNLDNRGINLYLRNIFKDNYIDMIIKSLESIQESFKNNLSSIIGYDFYTVEIFNFKDDSADLMIVSK